MSKKHVYRLLPILLWMALIFFLSHEPKDESIKYSQIAIALLKLLHVDLNDLTMGNATFLIRKAAHITEYGILCLLMWRYIQLFWGNTKGLIICFGLCVLYACTDEFHQTFIAGRVGCVQDVGVDSIGILFASLWNRRKIINL